jgi:xylose isomerase
MYEIIRSGGLTTGGFNFDTKLRRQSMDRTDLFHGHIGGIDTLAQSLLVAEALVDDGVLVTDRTARYADWDGTLGRKIFEKTTTLDSIADEATRTNLDPQPVSGRQEHLEDDVNRIIWSTT